ncbi:hypothetical protein [Legionella oakridgensis]|uniref:Neurogenic locus notch like protein n=2 Tax=Legionella oakridgensis TaxID=29423 RepID=W0BDP1_9GAMM|nr:hypothetical protein [Legionella oakridgensis]AHE66786.1 hypothetical protein Loa_01232 [Legionella oakridgensis ATCC 33761 = DSM 21215]ETO93502.1 hypothetical protein LOR_69c19390 [Legionella oakridgensis RV-2-2007]KTD39814.1 neurogenic locus notch like protein precursor [Legionella oakridgensis]STY19906.1 neurogenic locus notch like protein precursor [Legionella longbeachae]
MRRFLIAIAMLLVFSTAIAENYCANPCPKPGGTCYSPCPSCCENMGGVSYCDSSAGRFVCNNGYYSSCYCSRHAVMDLQKLKGCCLWQGGVMSADDQGLVVCNNGGVSEVCSTQNAMDKLSW